MASRKSGATAAKAVVKSWTDKGGKVLAQSRPVPIKQVIVSTRMSAEEQEQIRDALVGMSQTKAGREALDAVGYKGFVAPNRRRRDRRDQLARALTAHLPRRGPAPRCRDPGRAV